MKCYSCENEFHHGYGYVSMLNHAMVVVCRDCYRRLDAKHTDFDTRCKAKGGK